MINKPNHEYIDKLDIILQDIQKTEEHLKLLKNKLKSFPFEIPKNLSTKEKIEIGKYLYWSIKDIPSDTINKCLYNLKQKDFLNLMQTTFDNFYCYYCNKPIIFKSRAKLYEFLTDYKKYLSSQQKNNTNEEHIYKCDDCLNNQNKKTLNRFEKEDLIRQRKINKLRQLSYKKYLQTEHWQQVRTKHLKQSKFRCQICNSNKTVLHVHHRTYENLGEEKYNDVITLCEDCHKLFHIYNKI